MKVISTVFIFIMCISLFGCTSGNQVSGRSMKTATRSVNRIKNRLPEEKRIEFEVSFWTMHDAIKNRDDFLGAIDGKTYDELIDMGKEVFQERKNSGFEKYTQYTNWDQMIATFTQERIDQNRHKKIDPRSKKGNPSVMYQL